MGEEITRSEDRLKMNQAIKIYNQIHRLRIAIRREGTPAIQEAWDKLEPHVSIFLQAAHEQDTK